MKSLLEFLIAPITLAVIAWVGLIGGYVYFRKSKPNGRLSFLWNTITLTSGRGRLPNDIEIIYRGKSIPHVAQTTLIVWNSGNTILDRASFVERDPLRLSFGEDVTVLQAQVVEATRDVLQVSTSASTEKANEVLLSFDFLEPGDGARLAILNTGFDAQPQGLGTLKGVRCGLENRGPLDLADTVARSPWHIAGLTVLIGFVLFSGIGALFLGAFPDAALSFFPHLGKVDPPDVLPGKVSWLKIAFGVFLLFVTYFTFVLNWRTFPRKFILPRTKPSKT